MKSSALLASVLPLLTTLSLARPAAAQTTEPQKESRVSARDIGLPGFDLNAHYIPTTGDRFLGVGEGVVFKPSYSDKDASNWVERHASAMRIDIFDFALSPLRLRQRTAGSDRSVKYLSHQFYFNLGLMFTLVERLGLGFDFAIGGSKASDEVDKEEKKSTVVAPDPRIFARFGITGDATTPFAAAIQADVWLPIGTANKLTADERIRFLPRVLISGVAGHFFYAANAGLLLRRHHDFGNAEVGNAITYGFGLGLTFGGHQKRAGSRKMGVHQVGAELYGNTVLPADGSDSPFLGTSSSPAELLFSYRYTAQSPDDHGRLGLFLGAGPGLTQAPGVPALRLLAGFNVTGPVLSPEDTDKDGVVDDRDKCPEQPGDRAHDGCPPPPDSDGDSVPDDKDKCPGEPGDPKNNGCPRAADKDKDGIPDQDDACIDQPGPRSTDRSTSGCPDGDKDGIVDSLDKCPTDAGPGSADGCPDMDKDGVVDKEDACPDVAGPRNADPLKNGCPARARLLGADIVINEQILFQQGTATIDKASDALLNEVATILKEHPEIELLSIEGHSDNKGVKAANKTLSQARAASVLKALVTRGVDAKRLSAAGFGDEKPIASNDTEEGRAKNRRVEFHARKMRDASAPTTTPPATTPPATPKGPAPKTPAPKEPAPKTPAPKEPAPKTTPPAKK